MQSLSPERDQLSPSNAREMGPPLYLCILFVRLQYICRSLVWSVFMQLSIVPSRFAELGKKVVKSTAMPTTSKVGAVSIVTPGIW